MKKAEVIALVSGVLAVAAVLVAGWMTVSVLRSKPDDSGESERRAREAKSERVMEHAGAFPRPSVVLLKRLLRESKSDDRPPVEELHAALDALNADDLRRLFEEWTESDEKTRKVKKLSQAKNTWISARTPASDPRSQPK